MLKEKNNNLKVNIIMKQLKKTIMTLVALFAMTAGAWADGTLQVTEIKASDISAWSGDHDTALTAADLPGFKAVTFDEAKAWAEAPSGDAILIYAFDGNDAKYVHFNNGAYNDTYSQSISRGMIYNSTYYGQQIFYTGAPASSEPQTLDLTEAVAGKQWTAVMPGGNVTLEPEYYPQAELATAPTAINDVPATTDGAIVSAGTVANIGETTTAQGTVMYYVSPTALDDAALQALTADQWTADVPTAADLAQGQAYVYYYVRGNDSDTDDEIFSDGDILAANALTVTIAAAPLWNAEFDLTNAPEEDKAGKWSTDIPEGGVVKGTEVKVTYTGTKKVIGVKAEKKAAGVKVTAITLNKTATTIKVGATETLSVTAVAPDNATDKTYTWKTSDESKATVDQDGKVTAVAAGTVTIYAEANDGSGVKGNCTVTVTPATITVTWNNNDITGTYGNSFTKDGVTITAGLIDFEEKNFMDGGTFTTTLGNFTKIEVTAGDVEYLSGTGWSGSDTKKTWTGNASSVSFNGEIMGMDMGNTKFVFTIEPTN